MKGTSFVMAVGIFLAAAAPAVAQRGGARDTARKARTEIPADARPPKGMCRIWIDNVPATQQPAATDCATAVKNRPANGRVVFGDDYADTAKARVPGRSKLSPGPKGFTGVKTKPVIPVIRPPA